jgi:hypothetical protein
MVMGDMPPPLLLEPPRGPWGPFCMPLRTSIRPITRLPYRLKRRSAGELRRGNKVEKACVKHSRDSTKAE